MTTPYPSIISPKANAGDFYGRFREIVSDPLNMLIARHPLAGHMVEDGTVILHNGNRVPAGGANAYYGSFSYILMINRGVHEPLEEYVFQELLKVLPEAPSMLELGAYWAHYSMWLKKLRPHASVHMVEPNADNIQTGKNNFAFNQFTGEFVQAFVGHGHFGVDTYLREKGISKLNILHADIQSFEVEMLKDSAQALQSRAIDYLFVSTHTQELHTQVVEILQEHGYRVEVSSDFDFETTSYDGFIFASSPLKDPVFKNFNPMSRQKIPNTTTQEMLAFLTSNA
jgi:hypothetical protein